MKVLLDQLNSSDKIFQDNVNEINKQFK